MKALCSGCGGTGAHPLSDGGDRCWDCLGRGYVDAQMASGELYTLRCKKCGFQNGARVVSEEFPLPKGGPDIGCVRCNADRSQVHYVKVVDPDEN